ncbi:DUF4124 domain-containing protein [Shewanella phaeophyticola]|uniref:DUF4124 domain-containing protein n=1 Tax=Shewanella phaeophyticola TaxID=2978345 RepID=A0ABT2P341_9GAMM|nr:DUF4124 domain-containing protein [Shewanella sp. KJ10-1]MCT8986344.1 DUF4124 domain-containing protein [Shewanella sp. KJ10-1]
MRKMLIIGLCSISFLGTASDIFKCKDSSGKVTYSDMPCLTDSGTEEKLNKREPQSNDVSNLASVNKKIKPLQGYDSKSIEHYLESLKFDKFSQVLSGVQKSSFHGIDIKKLVNEPDVNLEKVLLTDESLEYLFSVSKDYKLFFVKKAVYNDDANSHPFLDLSDSKIISILSSRGFGSLRIGLMKVITPGNGM